MKIKVRGIGSDGLDYEGEAMPADLDLLEEFVDPERPVVVKGRFDRINNFVLANVTAAYTLDTICARCLEKINREVVAPYKWEIELRPGDEFIDLGVRVREELLISFNRRVLCQEDCKGICTGCGAYLNEEECQCGKDKSKK